MIDPLQQALLRAQEEEKLRRQHDDGSENAVPRDGAGGARIPDQTSATGPGAASRFAVDSPFQRISTPVVALNRAHLHRHCIATDAADDPLRAPFDLLRTKVVQRMRAEGWRTLAVLSADEEEGKTVAAINLALSIAKLPSQTAMLLDFDFRNPGLLSTLGHAPPFGMNDWLSGACVFEQTLFSPGSERVVASGVRASIEGSAEMLASRRIAQQLDEVVARYDDRIIIVDMPPMLRSDDALMLIPHIDCFLMVVAAGQSLSHRVKECLPMIPQHRLLGTVLNKSLR
jgi:protein-tyrosine kinase